MLCRKPVDDTRPEVLDLRPLLSFLSYLLDFDFSYGIGHNGTDRHVIVYPLVIDRVGVSVLQCSL